MESIDHLRQQINGIAQDIEEGYKITKFDINNFDVEYKEGDIMSASDYLEQMLDIEYITDRNGDYLGAKILMTFGGPNIYINTRYEQIEGYWWGDEYKATYTNDEMGIDDFARELWGCR